MPERARTDLWEPQGSNPLGPPGGTLRTFFAAILDRIGRLWTVPGTGSASSQA